MISGGVDSSVAALLLNQSGWKVLGITMKIPIAESCTHPRPCCGVEAAVVCERLGIAHYFIDAAEAFERCVVGPFRDAYSEGLTPNPCLDCNTFLKFGVVWDFLEARFGITHLATGHYARVEHRGQAGHLVRAAQMERDQSYFLYGISRRRLPRLVLPLGGMTKDAVRTLAREHGLPVADRQDSMELCFAGEGNYRRALLEDGEDRSGPILDTTGAEIGRHEGIFNYTLGQRRGLTIATGEPLYVIDISPDNNSITVGTRAQACRREVTAENVNVLIPELLHSDARLYGKLRSYGDPKPCIVKATANGTISVEFERPQFAPTAGQHLVLYDER